MSFFDRFSPFENLLDLQRELDHFLREPTLDLGPSGRGAFPPVNVFRSEDGVVIRAEVPGVSPDGLDISAEEGTLRISGSREPDSKTDGSFHRRERSFGRFSRAIQIPVDLDPAKARAECRHGLLTITVPRRESAKPRSIQVQS